MIDIEAERRRVRAAERPAGPGDCVRRWRAVGEAMPAVLDELERTREERDALRRELHAAYRTLGRG